MTRDSKLGMLAGVLGVVLIAVVYYQKANSTPPDQAPTQPPAKAQMLSTPAPDTK